MIPDPQERFRKDIEARQKNVLLEDQIWNDRRVNAFAWHGDPKATTVQRVGLLLFGLVFLAGFVMLIRVAVERHTIFGGLVSLLILAISLRLLRNAFRRQQLRQ